jgi:predicted phage baseplate assembly protein
VILFEPTRTISIFSSPPPPQLASVITYTETVWYANAPDPNNPQTPPNKSQQDQYGPPIPIPHTQLKFRGTPGAGAISAFNAWLKSTVIRHGWQPVGQLIATPAAALDPSVPQLAAIAPAAFPPGAGAGVLVEDANANGVAAGASVSGSVMQLSGLPSPLPTLTPPFNVLYGLLQVSRGKTVVNEILGSGDATKAGQEFVLKNSPLTYLLSPSSISGQNYASTLTVRVDGVAWQEVASFYGQPPDSRVFVTREDENNQTHVMFGDGVNGARLPSGSNNVIATYRFGSGADSPVAGALSVIMKPQPNLKAIHNPVAVGGGADPDPPGQIRRYAPQSVLTFGRAISADDYESIAAQAPGVARARAYFAFDAAQQRALVTIYAGDNAAAVTAAQTALALAGDPNRPVAVKLAHAVPIQLYLTVLVDPEYDPAAVACGVSAALLDPQSGLFGASLRIGQTIYDSQIHQACLAVPGATAIHALDFVVSTIADPGQRHSPGVGGFFQLSAGQLFISTEIASDAE